MMTENIQLYFSLRSPYSWLALYRISLMSAELVAKFQMTPVFPPKDKLKLPEQAKIDYMVNDVNRIAMAYGLNVTWPKPFDVDWMPVHMATIYAEEQNKGIPFCLALYKARFVEGKDISAEDVMRDAAMQSGIDADVLLSVLNMREYKKKLLQGMVNAGKEGVFGVPFFVYRNSTYWGNDRLEWLLRDIKIAQGQAVPDLADDPFGSSC